MSTVWPPEGDGNTRVPVIVEAAFGARTDQPHADWVWTDITPDLVASPVTITRGRSDESSHVQPTHCDLVLDNQRGHYTPDHPASPHYPHITQGTPLRVTLDVPHGGLWLSGQPGVYATTEHSVDLNVTGDLDLRVDVEPATWRPGVLVGMARKYRTDGRRSWALWMTGNGRLRLRWSPDGDSYHTALSTEPVPANAGRTVIRARLEVDDGDNGHTVTFATGSEIEGEFDRLGDTITGEGTTAVNASTAPVEVGRTTGNGAWGVITDPFAGTVHRIQLLNDDDDVLADADFADLPAGAGEFTDTTGHTWQIHGVTNPLVRFFGFVVEWAPTWPYGDLSDGELDGEQPGEARVTVVAAGMLRRLERRTTPLRSTLVRDITSRQRTSVVAYWPLEDGADTTRLAPGLDHEPARRSGRVRMRAYRDLPASDAIGVLGGGHSYLTGRAPWYEGADTQRLAAVFAFNRPDDKWRTLLTAYTTGRLARWVVRWGPDGSLRLWIFNDDGDRVFNSPPIGFNLHAWTGLVSLHLKRRPRNRVQWGIVAWRAGSSRAGVITDTRRGTIGRITRWSIGSLRNAPSDVAAGHAMIVNGDPDDHDLWGLVGSSLIAWRGETAAQRIQRLCREEGIPLRIVGDPDDSEPVGPQRVRKLVDLLTEAATADTGGVLAEQRDRPGLVYRTRASLIKQRAALALDAGPPFGQIRNPFEPVADDSGLVNDVTVTRDGGGSITLTDEASIATAGRYDTETRVNADTDNQLTHLASWRLLQGTWPGMRHRQLSPQLNIDPDVVTTWLHADLGDRLTVHRLPPQHPPGPVDLLGQGYAETLEPHRLAATVNTTPGGPWSAVGTVADDDPDADPETARNRVDTHACRLAAGIDTDTTELPVETTVGPRWIDTTSYPDDFPFLLELGGEHVRVTAITGTSAEQVMTVERAVNGISRPHTVGTSVALAYPAYLG